MPRKLVGRGLHIAIYVLTAICDVIEWSSDFLRFFVFFSLIFDRKFHFFQNICDKKIDSFNKGKNKLIIR